MINAAADKLDEEKRARIEAEARSVTTVLLRALMWSALKSSSYSALLGKPTEGTKGGLDQQTAAGSAAVREGEFALAFHDLFITFSFGLHHFISSLHPITSSHHDLYDTYDSNDTRRGLRCGKHGQARPRRLKGARAHPPPPSLSSSPPSPFDHLAWHDFIVRDTRQLVAL